MATIHSSHLTSLWTVLLLPALLSSLLLSALASPTQQVPLSTDGNGRIGDDDPLDEYIKVPVTLGVMSKCPDAFDCENTLDTVLEKVGMRRVNVTMQYIAKIDHSEPTWGVTCKHGPQECAGNLQQLCVQKHVKQLNRWWPWLECVNMAGLERVGNLELAVDCALMAGIDWVQDGLYSCIVNPGREGVELLQENVKETTALGIERSCTIQISGKTRCVRDGGEWKDCEGGSSVDELAKSIEQEWMRLNPDFAPQ